MSLLQFLSRVPQEQGGSICLTGALLWNRFLSLAGLYVRAFVIIIPVLNEIWFLLNGFTPSQEETLRLHWSSAIFKTSGSLWVSWNVKSFPKGDLPITVQHRSLDKQQKSDDALNLVSVQSIPVLQTDLQSCYLISNNIKASQCFCNEFTENQTLTYAPTNGEVVFVTAFSVHSLSCVGVYRYPVPL